MTKSEERKKLFIRYLKENNIYQLYIDNAKKSLDNKYSKYMMSKILFGNLNVFDIEYNLFGVFKWNETLEGYDFWYNAYSDWLKTFKKCKDINKKDFTIFRKRKLGKYKVIRK